MTCVHSESSMSSKNLLELASTPEDVKLDKEDQLENSEVKLIL